MFVEEAWITNKGRDAGATSNRDHGQALKAYYNFSSAEQGNMAGVGAANDLSKYEVFHTLEPLGYAIFKSHLLQRARCCRAPHCLRSPRKPPFSPLNVTKRTRSAFHLLTQITSKRNFVVSTVPTFCTLGMGVNLTWPWRMSAKWSTIKSVESCKALSA